MKDNKSAASVVIMMGPQGSGKGTQAEILAEKYGFIHLEMGQLLRDAAEKQNQTGKKLKKAMLAGGLVPSVYAINILAENIKRVKGKNIIIDGAPRQLVEAYALEKNLRKEGLGISLVVMIDIPEKESIKRMLLRHRADDTKEAIKKRLNWTKLKTSKALNYFSKHYPVVHINGAKTIKQVNKEIVNVLKQHQIV